MDSQPASESYLSDDSTTSSRSSSSRLPPLTSSAFDPIHHPAPPLPPSVPALVLHKLCAASLSHAGFDAAAGEALDELEGVVAEFFGSLLEYAHALAELGRRHVPNAVDAVGASAALGVGGPGKLLQELNESSERQALPTTALQITYARPRAPTPPGPRLASDDEADPTSHLALPDDLASPPPSPPPSPLPPLLDDLPPPPDHDDDDDDAEFEEVMPLSATGSAFGAPSSTSAAAPTASGSKNSAYAAAAAARRAERAAKLAAREAAQAARRAERERRRRERKRREEADPLRASWLPALPPKHSWKHTAVYPQSAPPPPLPPPISRTQQAPSTAALAHLSTLRARLNDSQLVSSSLRNLIRRTRAAGAAAAGAGAGGGGGAAVVPALPGGEAGDDGADVVDYEGEWYGAAAAAAAGGGGAGAGGRAGSRSAGGGTGAAPGQGKRRIRVLTVGGAAGGSDDDEADERERERKEAAGQGGALGGGGGRGAGKRRRWLV